MRRMRKSVAVWLTLGLVACALATACPALAGEAAVSVETFRYAEVATEKGTLNMRAEPKDNAKVLEKLPRGSIVRLLDHQGEWMHILYGGATGYVKTSFMKEITELPYTLITKESSGEEVIAFKRALYKLEYIKSDDINQRFDQVLERALIRLQLMNNVALDPGAVTPELQALMEWGMIEKGKSGYIDTATDPESGLTVGIFCWDSGGMLYEGDQAVKVQVSFAAQATGGQAPYAITVKKTLGGGGEAFGDEVTSPFSYIWGQDSDVLYVYATAVDAAGNTVTACAPFQYKLPERYQK